MKRQNFDWGTGGFLIGYQLFLLISLPFYFYFYRPSGALIAFSAALLYLIGLSVTAGYHRYFSHNTFKAHPLLESVLLFLGALSIQSSALRWSHDHRLHHAHVDTDEDPYSINKGFWYAHFLWMLEKQKPIDEKLVSDLVRNPRVRFQHRFIISLMFGLNALVWLLVGWSFNDYVGAFFIAVLLRIFVLHHFTWFINSLAHTWGDKPFCQEQTAVNNMILSVLTFGEGYHNYHHVFAKDYRNGVRWYHFDPTKWLLWGLSKVGLVKNLRRMDPITIEKRMVLERKNLLLQKLTPLNKGTLELEVCRQADKLLATLKNLSALRQEFSLDTLKEEFSELQARFKEELREWKALSKTILHSKAEHLPA